MKKTLIWVLFALLSGAILGKLTFDSYKNVEIKNVISIDDKVYMIKYKSYKNLDDMTNKIRGLDRYIYIEEQDKVTAYVGASTSEKNALKIVNIYKDKNINLTVEKVTIKNEEFIQNLNEYEKLLNATDDENSLLIIEKQILSCYEQTVVKNE